MFSEERREENLSTLNQNGRVSVDQLAILFSISEKTSRKDLNQLVNQAIGAQFVRQTLFKDISVHWQIDSSALLKKLSDKPLFSQKQHKISMLGAFNIDIRSKVEHFPPENKSLFVYSRFLDPGAKDANQAVTSTITEADAYLGYKIGQYQFSQFAYNYLSNSLINLCTIYQSETEPTENVSIFAYPGDNKNMLTRHLGAIINAMPVATNNEVQVALNGSPLNQKIIQYYHLVDILICTHTETGVIATINMLDLNSTLHGAETIFQPEARVIVIISFILGILIYKNKLFYHLPPYPAVFIVTTGLIYYFYFVFITILAGGNSYFQAAKYA